MGEDKRRHTGSAPREIRGIDFYHALVHLHACPATELGLGG